MKRCSEAKIQWRVESIVHRSHAKPQSWSLNSVACRNCVNAVDGIRSDDSNDDARILTALHIFKPKKEEGGFSPPSFAARTPYGALLKVTKSGKFPVVTGAWEVNAPPEPIV